MTKPVQSDTGTPERHKKGDMLEMVETAVAGVMRVRNDTSTQLDRYFVKGLLHERHNENDSRGWARLCGGRRLQQDFHASGLEQGVTGAYSEPMGGGHRESWLNGRLDARKRYIAASKSMKDTWGIVRRVCIDDSECSKADLPKLRDGLDRAARFYGVG